MKINVSLLKRILSRWQRIPYDRIGLVLDDGPDAGELRDDEPLMPLLKFDKAAVSKLSKADTETVMCTTRFEPGA